MDFMIYLESTKQQNLRNMDIHPRDTFKLAEIESFLWAEPHALLTRGPHNIGGGCDNFTFCTGKM